MEGLSARYRRNILVPGVGEEGQRRLARAAVLVIGAGGLGSAAAFYLAAAGVGRLGLVDADRVEITNLQRQILHRTADLGHSKVGSARAKLVALNPAVRVVPYAFRLDERLARAVFPAYHSVVDATDNLAARRVINQTCVALGIPFVHGAVRETAGQVLTVRPGRGPCLGCLFGAQDPPAGETGILGPVAGVVGTLQAVETLKILLGLGEPLVGRLLLVDLAAMRFYEERVERDPACPVCGQGGLRTGG